MTTATTAQRGELVRLAVDAAGGDGFAVRFDVTTTSGEVIAVLEAPVAAGVARVTWPVDVGDRSLPLRLTFTAAIGDQRAVAGELDVTPPGQLGAIHVVSATGGDAAPGTIGPLVRGAPPPQARGEPTAVSSEFVALCIDVAGPDGAPLVGEFELRIVLERESARGKGDFTPIDDVRRALDAAGEHTVHAVARRPSLAPTIGDPRIRFRIGWSRRPGQAAAGAGALELTTEPQ